MKARLLPPSLSSARIEFLAEKGTKRRDLMKYSRGDFKTYVENTMKRKVYFKAILKSAHTGPHMVHEKYVLGKNHMELKNSTQK